MMILHPQIIAAIEQLEGRGTAGDIAATAGLEINWVQRELLTLASATGGHLQVTASGEVAYLFPQNFRAILRNKFWRLKVQTWGQKIWRLLFYCLRISFGILLLASLLIILITIGLFFIYINSSSKGENTNNQPTFKGISYRPSGFLGSSWFWFLSWDYQGYSPLRRRDATPLDTPEIHPKMNFFEAIFSFIFGDGNPNYNLEERRWQTIAAVIRHFQGAVIAEQITPYLDDLGQGSALEFEDYMLPVLIQFNGRPEVSDQGQLIYHFPDLQTTVNAASTHLSFAEIDPYLKELPWRFSAATTYQILWAIGLGSLNIIGALMVGNILTHYSSLVQSEQWFIWVQLIYPILLSYGIAFLFIPLMRYFWIQRRNRQLEKRNQQRHQRAMILADADETLQTKMAYAHQFAAEIVIHQEKLAYTTEKDLLEQAFDESV